MSMCREAASVVTTDDEKKLLLAALGRIDSPDAIETILPYLDNASVRTEAATAALGIAERLLNARNSTRMAPRLVEPLRQISTAGASPTLTNRAKALLGQARQKTGNRPNTR
jgi:hypothetical protein